MAKSSQRQRRPYARIPGGGGYRVVSRMPVHARQLSRIHDLSPTAAERLKMVNCARRYGAAHAAEIFGVSLATVYRWQQRFDPTDLRSLENRSRRPKQTRKRVLAAREQYPRWGKAKLRSVLLLAGHSLSESTIGRILTSLKRRDLLIEPAMMPVRRRRAPRPYATRTPVDQRRPTVPGALLQVDTMHLRPLPGTELRQFTAVDVVSRWAVTEARTRATAGTATDFLGDLLERMPFPVQAIQVDGGSEFMASFETTCADLGIDLFVLPPRSPKLNGHVERLNGTARREFWECYAGDLDLPSVQSALRAWVDEYNHFRPHQALGHLTPAAFLASTDFSHVSN
jgi:putative transposase